MQYLRFRNSGMMRCLGHLLGLQASPGSVEGAADVMHEAYTHEHDMGLFWVSSYDAVAMISQAALLFIYQSILV